MLNINYNKKECKDKSRLLHSFSMKLSDSPDHVAARQVADYFVISHNEITFTVDEGIDALSQVRRHGETYDITTIRASTPMYLMAGKIKAMGMKRVLSGEGSDEMLLNARCVCPIDTPEITEGYL